MDKYYFYIEQQEALAKSFGCARWYWNYALHQCIQHYEQTGKSLPMKTYKGMLPQLKVEHPWLKTDCYSSVLQCVAINLNKAYTNFWFFRTYCAKLLIPVDKFALISRLTGAFSLNFQPSDRFAKLRS
ncbi:helix-turn-helix domain-containing protein [Scytonema sp. NUACC21]